MNTTVDTLEKLGLTAASAKVKKLTEKKRKLAIAYEFHRVVREEKIHEFNQKLKEKTMKRNGYGFSEYQTLSFTPLGSYEEVPPANVLASLETAIERKCFDAFEIAHIVSVKDPILFGRVDGCSDRFFIDQWDDDVRIEDILAANEG